MPKRTPSPPTGGTSKIQKVDVSDLNPGDIISNTEYMVVQKVEGTRVHVQTLNGFKNISSELFEYASYKSPRQFTETQKVSKSKMIDIIRDEVKSHAFGVTFQKKDKSKRFMICRLLHFNNNFGRSDVIEICEKAGKFQEQQRQVDHRTIEELVFNGIRYTS